MAQRVIASSIEGVDLAQVAHDVVAERWDNWDLNEFLVYLVDTCAASALPYLAEQFNVDGLRGLAIATTEAEQRELIKQAIPIYKRIGTPWAIRRVCELVGFPIIILDENVVSDPPDPETDWARFRVYVQTPDYPVDGHVFASIRDFINIYKPQRSIMTELGLFLPFMDEHVFRDVFDHTDGDAIYDGEYSYDGEINYGGLKREYLDIQIVGEQMEYYPVIVDDDENFVVDDDSHYISIPDESDFLVVNPSSLELDPPENSGNFNVNSNTEWEVE